MVPLGVLLDLKLLLRISYRREIIFYIINLSFNIYHLFLTYIIIRAGPGFLARTAKNRARPGFRARAGLRAKNRRAVKTRS